jgi:uncharacterized protein YeaO (DUF488 family)
MGRSVAERDGRRRAPIEDAEVAGTACRALIREDGSGMLRSVSIRIVRLGSARTAGEGLRLGTVRRPPRGVPKADWARRDFYDVWLPDLAPSEALLKTARSAVRGERSWKAFARSYRKEMALPAARRLLELLAALSRETNLAVGCYCAEEARCHRSLLRALLEESGAKVE